MEPFNRAGTCGYVGFDQESRSGELWMGRSGRHRPVLGLLSVCSHAPSHVALGRHRLSFPILCCHDTILCIQYDYLGRVVGGGSTRSKKMTKLNVTEDAVSCSVEVLIQDGDGGRINRVYEFPLSAASMASSALYPPRLAIATWLSAPLRSTRYALLPAQPGFATA